MFANSHSCDKLKNTTACIEREIAVRQLEYSEEKVLWKDKLRIVIADANEDFRKIRRRIISDEEDMTVVASAGDGREALTAVRAAEAGRAADGPGAAQAGRPGRAAASAGNGVPSRRGGDQRLRHRQCHGQVLGAGGPRCSSPSPATPAPSSAACGLPAICSPCPAELAGLDARPEPSLEAVVTEVTMRSASLPTSRATSICGRPSPWR